MDERLLGELRADVRWIKREVTELRHDVKHLRALRFKIAGGLSVISAIVSAVVAGIVHLWPK